MSEKQRGRRGGVIPSILVCFQQCFSVFPSALVTKTNIWVNYSAFSPPRELNKAKKLVSQPHKNARLAPPPGQPKERLEERRKKMAYQICRYLGFSRPYSLLQSFSHHL